jgi:hypothetical protein
VSDATCLREAASAKARDAAGRFFQHPARDRGIIGWLSPQRQELKEGKRIE